MTKERKNQYPTAAAALVSLLLAACTTQVEAITVPSAPMMEPEELSRVPELPAAPIESAAVRTGSIAPEEEVIEAVLEEEEETTPSFDPLHPYRFCQEDSCVDFLDPATITVDIPFSESDITVNPVLHDPAVPTDVSLPTCEPSLLVTNARDGDSESEVWHKTVLYAHSGNCWGEWHPSEYFRNYLEGGYLFPDQAQREERLEELRGQTLLFDQGSGDVPFQIVDIAYLGEETVEQQYETDPGGLDRFFETGTQEGVHEVFWVFCGSVGLAHPDDPFVTRYVLRLQVVDVADAAS